jgi:hypothetical protein
VLHLLVTEIAQQRRDAALPVVEAPTPTAAPDRDVVIAGAVRGPADLWHLDRVGAMLAAFADWRIEVTLHDGSTINARPASAA